MNYTEKKAASLCNRVLNGARKDMNRRMLHNPWTDNEGRFCVCDGFRAYRLNEQPAGIVEKLSVNVDPSLQHIDLDTIFSPLYKEGRYTEMPRPDLDTLKAFIKEEHQRPAPKNIYDLGAEYPAVNMAYLRDVLELFPDGRFFVDADPYARMIHPIFVKSERGTAAVLPIRTDAKPWKKPEEKPAAAPVEETPAAPAAAEQPAAKPEKHSEPAVYAYWVYSRPAGENRFLLTNINQGAVGIGRFYAPRYKEEHFDKLKDLLETLAFDNPGAIFQIRTIAKKPRTVFTTAPVLTPEMFAAQFAA